MTNEKSITIKQALEQGYQYCVEYGRENIEYLVDIHNHEDGQPSTYYVTENEPTYPEIGLPEVEEMVYTWVDELFTHDALNETQLNLSNWVLENCKNQIEAFLYIINSKIKSNPNFGTYKQTNLRIDYVPEHNTESAES